MNEGWASYWHETLFLQDERIEGHEVDFARVNARVTSLPRVGLNPYALGMRLFYYIEELRDKGKLTFEFERLADADEREHFDAGTGEGRSFIFKVREDYSDSMFINTFLDQDFIDRHKLFEVGKRLNRAKMVWEYFVKSRSAEKYRSMIQESLYHPPHIEIAEDKGEDGTLYLIHHFEGKPLVKEFIANTMMGIEYLWGGPVELETNEIVPSSFRKEQALFPGYPPTTDEAREEAEPKWQRVLYRMKDRKLSRRNL
jgi:stage V sporulation protein R